MTTTERMAALQSHIKAECEAMQCRMIFVTYFDYGEGNAFRQGPSQSIAQGISDLAKTQLTKAAWYEMDKACNFMESIK